MIRIQSCELLQLLNKFHPTTSGPMVLALSGLLLLFLHRILKFLPLASLILLFFSRLRLRLRIHDGAGGGSRKRAEDRRHSLSRGVY